MFENKTLEELNNLEKLLLEERNKREKELSIDNISKVKSLEWIKEIPFFVYEEGTKMMSHCSFVYKLYFSIFGNDKIKFIKEATLGYSSINLFGNSTSFYENIYLTKDNSERYFIGTSNEFILSEFIETHKIIIKYNPEIVANCKFYANLEKHMLKG